MTEELQTTLGRIFSNSLEKIVISNAKNTEYKKITIQRQGDSYQAEKLTEKQAFHENICPDALPPYVAGWMDGTFKQLNAWGGGYGYSLKLSKKGKVLFQKKKTASPGRLQTQNNRQKSYFLEEGIVIPPLVDMGVFTTDGKIVASMYDKYRQINKFIQFIDEAVEKSGLSRLHIIDFGCGKSYLTFVVYYYLTQIKRLSVIMTGLDLKADVIEKCNAAAQKYGYKNLHFEAGDIEGYQTAEPVDMVITLHACDTATDYALYHAIRWNTTMIISVPCCQHELNAQIQSDDFRILTRYGIIKERMAALMTDTIRGNLLEYCGYKTQLLEFVDFTHTPKNILIRAVKSNIPKEHRQKMLDEVERLIQEFHLQPTLYRLLCETPCP